MTEIVDCVELLPDGTARMANGKRMRLVMGQGGAAGFRAMRPQDEANAGIDQAGGVEGFDLSDLDQPVKLR